MATKYTKLRGKLAWVKAYDTDEYLGKEFWSANFYPADDNEWKKFDASGSQLKRRTDDGSKSGIVGDFVKLRRNKEKTINGRDFEQTPPNIFKVGDKPYVKYVDAEGALTNEVKEGVKGIGTGREEIGNNTEAYVTITTYDTRKGKGTDWLSIEVIDLVPFVRNRDLIDDSDLEEVPF